VFLSAASPSGSAYLIFGDAGILLGKLPAGDLLAGLDFSRVCYYNRSHYPMRLLAL
jgi:hypothetical protein